MPTEPTKQQHDLQSSCPHQNWENIDLSQHVYKVRRSSVNPRESGFISENEPAETRSFNRPTPALNRSWEIAKAYKAQGYKVVRDVQWAVHQLSKAGEPTFYLFIEFQPKPLPGQVPVLTGGPKTVESSDSVSISISVDKRELKVLKALAELREQPLSDLLKNMVIHSLAGSNVFSPEERGHISHFKRIYGVCEDGDE